VTGMTLLEVRVRYISVECMVFNTTFSALSHGHPDQGGGEGVSSEGDGDRATAKKMSLQKNHPSQPRYSQEATKKQKGGDSGVFACTFRVLRGPAGPVFCVFVFWAGPQGLCFVFLCFGPALRACVLCFRVLAAPPQNTVRRQESAQESLRSLTHQKLEELQ
jgi:hypothetical protein